MLKRVKASFSFRSAVIYRAVLKLLGAKTMIKPINNKLNMITLCGQHHITLLIESLNSVIRNFEKIPRITVYSDGSLSTKILSKKLSKFSRYVTVESWETCILSGNNQETALTNFAKKHPIGKKLLVIVKNAKDVATLWWDTDIIWFKDLENLKINPSNRQFSIITSEDYQPSYDENLVNDDDELLQKPYINTGVVFLSGNLLKEFEMETVLSSANEHPSHFSEQTILAKAVFIKGKQTWSIDVINCSQSDHLTVKPTYLQKRWTARHYVGPVRHLFWRDALFDRLGFKKITKLNH